MRVGLPTGRVSSHNPSLLCCVRIGLKCILLVTFILPIARGNEEWKIVEKVKTLGCQALGMECCRPPNLNVQAIRDLKKMLKYGYFGQHIVISTVVPALEAHLRDDKPGKALVFSFHGWAGSGKTYLSELIARALYKKGLDSAFVKFYMASFHFPNPEKVVEYQDMIRADISNTLSKCERSMFVFDEVDKIPPGVFDAIMPYVDYPGKLNGIEHKKAIFIFLSNTASTDITRITYESWKNGKLREDLTFRDFDDFIKMEAFNKKGNGLYKSSLIDRVLVDYFVPFLPLEREHVVKCAEVEALRLGGSKDSVDVNEIADNIAYWPADVGLYSQTGCKKVEGDVKLKLSAARLANSKDEEDDDDYDEDRSETGKTEL